MTRLLVTSDWHLDWYTAGLARFADVERAARGTVDLARRERCDGYAFLGDASDPGPRAHRCTALLIELDRELHAAGIWRRWLVGNHDVVEDGTNSSTLSPLAAAGERLADLGGVPASFRVFDRPDSEWLAADVAAVWLPHPTRSQPYVPEAFVRGVELREPRVVLVLGHLTVPGIEPGSETKEMPRGREVRYPLAAVRERWGERALMLNGHYHRSYRRSQSPVVVPGSLERLTRGESQNIPGCVILEV